MSQKIADLETNWNVTCFFASLENSGTWASLLNTLTQPFLRS